PFFFPDHPPHLTLLSFPTRRSSDLVRDVRAAYRPAVDIFRLRHDAVNPVLDLVGQRSRSRLQKRLERYTKRHLREMRGNGKALQDRKSTRLNSSHDQISYAVFCLKK